MKKKIIYFGILPIITTVVITGILYLIFPKESPDSNVWIWTAVLFYFGFLIGWGFIYLTSEGWGDKETLPDAKGQKKIILIASIIGLISTVFLVYFLGSYNSISEMISDWDDLLLTWFIIFGISWVILDICIWIKKRKK